ncbi:MAG: lectin-like protein [Polyangiaceae bacterium]|nr:lectin-like protein [Polyangiaceae bacterium]
MFWILPLAMGCGDDGTGRLDVASVVAPLYAGVEVRYKAVAEGKSCDGHSEGEVRGAASRGNGGYAFYDLAFASESFQLPAGSYGICATVFDANGQLEARCPTTAIKVNVVANSASTAYLGIVCDPVIDERSGHAYTVTPLANSFLEAKDAAEQMGGHLVYIDDIDENLMLNQYFGRRKWIGLWDGDGDRTFEWLDGKQREFSNFCIGEPSPNAGEYYAEWGFGGADTNYCWNNEVVGVVQGIVEFE